ncbi:ABC transporter permease [Corynebacterium pseudotuberculosis]|uniref:ABC transporter permease n=1 Tax=Corynebacterium pseudotuberculosis TaxID=1719 RepID=UPI0001DD4456|nr:ABC transporter permease [Corynebacterium pseudotuberculosis]ADK28420.1 ABC transporter permease subunit [Corynebacterium pseudotuberculosis FRC41]ADL20517.1 ABC transporter permease [Corynebacterium pseudotuberculosis 1002]AEX39103.1 Oligopeptide transport system permease protein oppB [Corynebacterium pseudotuberculosis 3/99-5]AIG07004.1 ABC transporter permease protein [Corynebacterium pseudotuberculosis]AIG08413.1 ABC transporter permease protein [Corynebacterium pseudotuberculosis]
MPKAVSRACNWLFPRLAIRAGALLVVLGLVFFAIDQLPGNAAAALLGANRTPEAIASFEQSLGLDRPPATRFLYWLGHALTGDFGVSVHGRPIVELLATALPVTITTTGIAFILTAVLSILTSIWWVQRSPRSGMSRTLEWASTSIIALPEFVIGVFLVAVFALGLGVLPAVTIIDGGLPSSTTMYILPVLALVIPQVAWNSRVLRAALIDATATRPVQSAMLAGVTGTSLLRRHVLPLAIPSFATSMATSAGVLIAGTVSVEALFNHPGVGLLVATAVSQRDVSVLLAVLAATGALILLLLTMADILKIVCTPKVNV